MIIRNRFHSALGPGATWAGYMLLIGGTATAFTYPAAILMAIFGAFMAFTHSTTHLDVDRRRVRFTNMLFGIFPIGNWVAISPDMRIGIKKSRRVYTIFSRSNRQLDVLNVEFQVILYNARNSPIMPLARFSTPELAQAEADNLAAMLEL